MSTVETSVLEDPTGRRARWLRRAGRVVFVLFLGWLLAIVLGGLGLMPVAGVPLTHVLRPSQGPPVLAKAPKPRKPSASDLQPAVPAAVFAAAKAAAVAKPAVHVSPGKSALAPGHTKTTPAAGVVHGKSAVAPGHTKTTVVATTPGKSAVAPGQTKTTPAAGVLHGKSATMRGHTKTTTAMTTTTTPGRHPKKP